MQGNHSGYWNIYIIRIFIQATLIQIRLELSKLNEIVEEIRSIYLIFHVQNIIPSRSCRLKPYDRCSSRASRIREFAFQLWVIVFQSNSLHRSGRYEFTWRKYRPILHRDVINPSICTYEIYIYTCVCVYTLVKKSHFPSETKSIQLAIDRKARAFERKIDAISPAIVPRVVARCDFDRNSTSRLRTLRIFDLWCLCKWINRAIRRNWS